MVGRGLRLAQEKKELLLIDCVGVSSTRDLCCAPTLLGIDPPDGNKTPWENEIAEDLFDLPDMIAKDADTPRNWIRDVYKRQMQNYVYGRHEPRLLLCRRLVELTGIPFEELFNEK